MKRNIIVIIVVLTAIGAFYYIVFQSKIPEIIFFIHGMREQMRIGSAYMKSIDDEAFPLWIERTKSLIAQYSTNEAELELLESDIPEDLRNIGVLRVDIGKSSVRYVWLGGMDHTNLFVVKNENGEFEVFANFNDNTPEARLWPEQ